jgi:hypothetical protein
MPTPTITDINDIFLWFQQLDKPNQEQFANTLWSFRHKNDTIGVDDLTEELQDILNNATTQKGLVVLAPGTTTWTSPKGTIIDDIVIEDTVAEYTLSCGNTEGGTELLNDEIITDYEAIFPVKHKSKVDETIYFTGLNETAIIKLYIK